MTNHFLSRVRKLAQKQGMNVSQLEARVGCSQGTAWNIKNASNKWVGGFAKELRVPVSELFDADENTKPTAKPVVPGAVARKDVKKTVEQMGNEINKYYAPGSDWLPQWLDKPDLLAPDMSRNIISELLRRIKKIKAMPLDSVDLSLDAAKELKNDIDKQAEKADVQLDFYKRQNQKLINDKSDLESSRQSLIKRNDALNHDNIALKRENELLAEKEKNATYNMRTFEKKLKKQDEDAKKIIDVAERLKSSSIQYHDLQKRFVITNNSLKDYKGQVQDLNERIEELVNDRSMLLEKLNSKSSNTKDQYQKLYALVDDVSPHMEITRLKPDLPSDFNRIIEIGIQIGLNKVKNNIYYMMFTEEMEELSKGGTK